MDIVSNNREKIEALRREYTRFAEPLDEVVVHARRGPEYWPNITGAELRELFHLVLGVTANLNERITNLEEVFLDSGPARGASVKPASYRRGQDRSETDAASAMLSSEYVLLKGLINSTDPVSPVDRANIVLILTRLLDRFVWLHNELAQQRGESPVLPQPDAENGSQGG